MANMTTEQYTSTYSSFGGCDITCTFNGKVIRDCNFKQLDKMGLTLPPFSCHYLRHTFTTRMCEAGVNIKAMSLSR